MSVPAIFEEAFPLTALAGATPKQTFYAVVTPRSARLTASSSRRAPGLFKLNPKRRKAA